MEKKILRKVKSQTSAPDSESKPEVPVVFSTDSTEDVCLCSEPPRRPLLTNRSAFASPRLCGVFDFGLGRVRRLTLVIQLPGLEVRRAVPAASSPPHDV